MARRAGIIRSSSDAGEDNSSKREQENENVGLSTGYERAMERRRKAEADRVASGKRAMYDGASPTCDGQPAEDTQERKGFFSFFLPTVHNNVHSASESIERGERDDNRWAEANLNSADKQLKAARDDTHDRMKERDERNGGSDTDRNWLTSSIWDTKPESKPDKKDDGDGRVGSFFW